MHNKSFSIDNSMTIVGGRNIGDEYFGTHEGVNFGNIDVLAVGPVVAEVGAQFDLYWNSELAYPIQSLTRNHGDLDVLRRDLRQYVAAQRDSVYMHRVRNSDLAREFLAGTLPFQWGDALVFYDLPEKLVTDPEDRSTHLAPKVLPYTVGSVERDLLLFSPYFVPGEDGVMVLTDLEKRGVRVRVLTNSLASTDVGFVHAGYAKYRKPLLLGGVEIYEFKPDADRAVRRKFGKLIGSSGTSLHAKTSVMDLEDLFIGSPNMDPRSGKLNTELGILFESKPLAKGVADWFDDNQAQVAYRVSLDQSHCAEEHACEGRLQWTEQENGRQVIYLEDPQTGILTRFFVSLVSLLPIEGQL